MNSFSFWSPTKIVFGADTAGQIGSEVKAFGGTNALVFYGGGSAVKSGVLDIVTGSLTAEGIGFSCIGGIKPNPTAHLVQKHIDEYREKGIDFIIGVGGGSVIDHSKAVAHGLSSPDTPIWDFFDRKETVRESLPVGVVLTIAAAGSESSDSAVLTNTETGIKRGISTSFNRPRFAILDPHLTYSLPPRQTACGVTDILMHTLDRYFAPDTDNALTDDLAEALMRIVIVYGKIVMEKPGDYKARSEIMWAGSLSHNGLTGLGQTVDFSVHQLSHPLAGRYDIAHAESLSAVWAAWARFVYRDGIKRFAKYARCVWGVQESDDETAAVAGITATESFFRDIGMPVTLIEAAGERAKEDVGILTDLCTYNGTRTIGAFKVLDADDIRAIYQSAI